jgi:hypothetical protein
MCGIVTDSASDQKHFGGATDTFFRAMLKYI